MFLELIEGEEDLEGAIAERVAVERKGGHQNRRTVEAERQEEFLANATNCPLPLDAEHIGPVLLSPYGLKALVKTGQLTQQEAHQLNQSQLPPSQYGKFTDSV